MSYDRQQFIFDSKAKAFIIMIKVTPTITTFLCRFAETLILRWYFYAKIAADETKTDFRRTQKRQRRISTSFKTYMETATTDSNPCSINFTYRN